MLLVKRIFFSLVSVSRDIVKTTPYKIPRTNSKLPSKSGCCIAFLYPAYKAMLFQHSVSSLHWGN